jgi:hypothetical protein
MIPMPHAHLKDYTRTISGVPRQVWPGDAKHPTHIIFWVGPAKTDRVYTWNAWAAAFCEEAKKNRQSVTVAYSKTSWGLLLIDVDYTEPEMPAS